MTKNPDSAFKRIPVSELVLADECQCRFSINQEVVAEYAEAYRNGETLPPIIVFWVDQGEETRPYVVDGWHRVLAAQRAELETLPVFEHGDVGTVVEAAVHASAANTDVRGLRRSWADKRAAVNRMLSICPHWSDRAIASHCNVSHPFVGKLREAMKEVPRPEPRPERQEPEPNYEPEVRGAQERIRVLTQQAQAPYGRLLKGIDDLIDQARRELNKKAGDPVVKSLQDVRETVFYLEPVPCPSAAHHPSMPDSKVSTAMEADGTCKACRDAGWVPRHKERSFV